jgi:hypothetical protein
LGLSAELEAGAADSAPHLVGKPKPPPPPGAHCANCGAALEGPYCHVCGQEYDRHKRSIFHLIWEAIEGLLHLDGRLSRTLPALFFRPGSLARDYMEGRMARHVPPFRTFLVALLLFIFAAEHAIHKITEASEHKAHERAAELATPAGRAAEAGRLRQEATETRDESLADAAKDRAEDLKDPDEDKTKVEARYAKAVASAQDHYAKSVDKADRLARGEQVQLSYSGTGILGSEDARNATLKAIDASGTVSPGAETNAAWLKAGLKKAVANPEYYLTVMFTWGHRLAVLLLPIVGLSLAVVYVNRRRVFIYDHLQVAMNLLSFAFLTNALGFVLPMPWQAFWFGIVAVWTPINLFQTLRGAYGSSILGASIKTLIVWFSTVLAFTLLVAGLMIFTLGQL